MRTQDAATGAGCSSMGLCGARVQERLLDTKGRSAEYTQEQLTLDRLLAPVLTKALLQGEH